MLAVIIIPLIAVLAAVPVAWNRWISWLDIALALILYVIAAGRITIGYHPSPFTHRSFARSPGWPRPSGWRAHWPCRRSIASWVASHRKHHANSDEGRPLSLEVWDRIMGDHQGLPVVPRRLARGAGTDRREPVGTRHAQTTTHRALVRRLRMAGADHIPAAGCARRAAPRGVGKAP